MIVYQPASNASQKSTTWLQNSKPNNIFNIRVVLVVARSLLAAFWLIGLCFFFKKKQRIRFCQPWFCMSSTHVSIFVFIQSFALPGRSFQMVIWCWAIPFSDLYAALYLRNRVWTYSKIRIASWYINIKNIRELQTRNCFCPRTLPFLLLFFEKIFEGMIAFWAIN